ncbi:hypothetical protein NHP21005_02670 [Helicobacter sp. NHP21005]|nr:hypothetical protein NHP21005_02670 [Helicobacter sp. NHP21005]
MKGVDWDCKGYSDPKDKNTLEKITDDLLDLLKQINKHSPNGPQQSSKENSNNHRFLRFVNKHALKTQNYVGLIQVQSYLYRNFTRDFKASEPFSADGIQLTLKYFPLSL